MVITGKERPRECPSDANFTPRHCDGPAVTDSAISATATATDDDDHDHEEEHTDDVGSGSLEPSPTESIGW